MIANMEFKSSSVVFLLLVLINSTDADHSVYGSSTTIGSNNTSETTVIGDSESSNSSGCEGTDCCGCDEFFQWLKCAVQTKEIMFFSAGFMTASLLFSVGCFASKYKTSARRKKKSEKSKGNLNDESPLSASQNEGSCESDQKSYAYWDIKPKAVKSANDMTSSVKSAKSLQRESYDFVEHHRAKSSLVIENDIPNPYNHVTIDMEVTEYDNASHVKPRIEIKDPTYSHLSEVKSEHQQLLETGKGGNKSHPLTKENNVTGEKDTTKTKGTNKDNHLEEEVKVELENKNTDFDICDEKAKNETNVVMNDECKGDKLDDNRTNDQQDVHGLNKHKTAYSVVWKNPNVDKVAENNKTKKAFIFSTEMDSSRPIAKSSEEINTSNDNGATTSLSQSGSGKSSSQNGSDTDSLEVDSPPNPLAVNILYEDIVITDVSSLSIELD